MLYQIKPELLTHLVLPLGEYHKSEIVAKAEELGLPYTQVKESQDACFVDNNYVTFIEQQTGRSDFLKPGKIVDPEGRILGTHSGVINYTVGQRRGLGLGNGPWYVARIDVQENCLVVAREQDARLHDFRIERANWFIDPPNQALSCGVKIRYQINEVPCTVEPVEDGFRIILDQPRIVTPGQSAVFYDRDLVLGGGIIL
jgi:tRNA-specific 2-thiouridylase